MERQLMEAHRPATLLSIRHLPKMDDCRNGCRQPLRQEESEAS